MRKIFTLALLIFTTSFAFAQNDQEVSSGNAAYAKGDKIFQAGIGFGSFNYGHAGTKSVGLPPLTASVELGIHDHISVGPYLGYGSWKYSQTFYGNKFNYSWNYLSVGVRGSFHYLPFLNEGLELGLDEEKFDFYASLALGLEKAKLKSDGEDEFYGESSATGFRLAPVLGFKYRFNEKFGTYLELGRGVLSVGSIGVSVNF
jgi:hypothetical protein